MKAKEFIIRIILGLFICGCMFVHHSYGQEKDTTSVWMKATDLKAFFQAKLDEENKRHEQAVYFIQGQMSVTSVFVDSVKVKK